MTLIMQTVDARCNGLDVPLERRKHIKDNIRAQIAAADIDLDAAYFMHASMSSTEKFITLDSYNRDASFAFLCNASVDKLAASGKIGAFVPFLLTVYSYFLCIDGKKFTVNDDHAPPSECYCTSRADVQETMRVKAISYGSCE